VRYLAAL